MGKITPLHLEVDVHKSVSNKCRNFSHARARPYEPLYSFSLNKKKDPKNRSGLEAPMLTLKNSLWAQLRNMRTLSCIHKDSIVKILPVRTRFNCEKGCIVKRDVQPFSQTVPLTIRGDEYLESPAPIINNGVLSRMNTTSCTQAVLVLHFSADLLDG